MTSRDFCFWLQGYLELSKVDANKASAGAQLSLEQVACISKHLGYVFQADQRAVQIPSTGLGGLLSSLGGSGVGSVTC